MATTRKRRSRLSVPNELSPGLMDILCTGDCPDDNFLIFTVDLLEGGDYLPRLFREHRAAVLAEWTRRKGTGKPWIQRPGWAPLAMPRGR